MVVSVTSTDSSSGQSWIPLGKRRPSISTETSLVTVLYSRTLRVQGHQPESKTEPTSMSHVRKYACSPSHLAELQDITFMNYQICLFVELYSAPFPVCEC